MCLFSNPMGRTGMTGRGLLGRFGPNHAADPIVTRYRTVMLIFNIFPKNVLYNILSTKTEQSFGF